jgi:hypothetical protein
MLTSLRAARAVARRGTDFLKLVFQQEIFENPCH